MVDMKAVLERENDAHKALMDARQRMNEAEEQFRRRQAEYKEAVRATTRAQAEEGA